MGSECQPILFLCFIQQCLSCCLFYVYTHTHTHTPFLLRGSSQSTRTMSYMYTYTHTHTHTHTPLFLPRGSSQGTRTHSLSLSLSLCLSLSLSLTHTHTHPVPPQGKLSGHEDRVTHTQGTRTMCTPRHFYTGAPYVLSWAVGPAKCVPSGPDLRGVK